MIKHNGSNISDWYFDSSDIVKVYRNGAVCYYKITTSGGTPTFDVCYAVVDDISQYQETEFEDVYNKADSKWYKLNNLNQYEEYGVYGNGRNITYYEGKLTIDDGYEYQYSGNSWVNVGEVSGSSEESWAAATELIESTSYNNNSYTITKWKDNVSVFHGMKLDKGDGGYGAYCWADFKSPDYSSGSILSIPSSNEKQFIYHGNTYNPNGGGTMPSCFTLDNGWYIFDFDKMSSDDGYSGTYLYSYQKRFEIENMYFLTRVYTQEYPLYYDEKSDPLNNLSFSSMTEATEYAYNNCVYDGMKATIDGDGYYFDSEDENGWVENSSRLPIGYTEVEYIENTGTSYINTNLQIYSSTTNSFEIESKLIAAKHDSQTYQNVFCCMSEDGEPYQGFTYRYQSSSLVGTSSPNGQNTFTIINNEDSTQTVTVTSSTSQRTYTHTYPLTLFCGLNSSRSPFRWTNSKFYYCKIKMNDELVRDLVPCKMDSDDKYGMYDLVTNTFYVSPNNVDFIAGPEV